MLNKIKNLSRRQRLTIVLIVILTVSIVAAAVPITIALGNPQTQYREAVEKHGKAAFPYGFEIQDFSCYEIGSETYVLYTAQVTNNKGVRKQHKQPCHLTKNDRTGKLEVKDKLATTRLGTTDDFWR